MSERINWDLGDGRVVQISYTLITDFDINDLVKIDVNNLLGEYLTAPTLFNNIANLRSSAMEILARKKMQVKIIEKELYKYEKNKKFKQTIPEIDANIETSESYIEVQEELIEAEKNANLMDNLYWSMKEKCSKLDNLFHKISPEEFSKEIMEGQVNNVLIKIKKALIQ